MRRQPQQQRSRQMVEQIIAAGFTSLSRHGFEGSTTRHVAEIAGISPGTLYHYFPDKEAIYEAMYGQLIGEFVARLARLGPELVRLPLREALQHLLNDMLGWLSENDGVYLHAISFNPSLYGSSRMPQLEQALRELSMSFVVHNPRMIPLMQRPELAYVLQTCVIAGVLRHLSRPGMALEVARFVNELVDIVCAIVETALAAAPG